MTSPANATIMFSLDPKRNENKSKNLFEEIVRHSIDFFDLGSKLKSKKHSYKKQITHIKISYANTKDSKPQGTRPGLGGCA